MVIVNFHIEKHEHERFIQKVGKGNVSPTIRNFIKSYIGEEQGEKETVLRKKEAYYKSKVEEWNSKHQEIKTQLDKIDDKRKADEIKKLEDLQKQKDKVKSVKKATVRQEIHRMADGVME